MSTTAAAAASITSSTPFDASVLLRHLASRANVTSLTLAGTSKLLEDVIAIGAKVDKGSINRSSQININKQSRPTFPSPSRQSVDLTSDTDDEDVDMTVAATPAAMSDDLPPLESAHQLPPSSSHDHVNLTSHLDASHPYSSLPAQLGFSTVDLVFDPKLGFTNQRPPTAVTPAAAASIPSLATPSLVIDSNQIRSPPSRTNVPFSYPSQSSSSAAATASSASSTSGVPLPHPDLSRQYSASSLASSAASTESNITNATTVAIPIPATPEEAIVMISSLRASLCLPADTPLTSSQRTRLRAECVAFIGSMRKLKEDRDEAMSVLTEIMHPVALTILWSSHLFLENCTKWIRQFLKRHAYDRLGALLTAFVHQPNMQSVTQQFTAYNEKLLMSSQEAEIVKGFKDLREAVLKLHQHAKVIGAERVRIQKVLMQQWNNFDAEQWLTRCTNLIVDDQAAADDVMEDVDDSTNPFPHRKVDERAGLRQDHHVPVIPPSLAIDDTPTTTSDLISPTPRSSQIVAGVKRLRIEETRNHATTFHSNDSPNMIRSILRRRHGDVVLSPRITPTSASSSAAAFIPPIECKPLSAELHTLTLEQFLHTITTADTPFCLPYHVIGQLLIGQIPKLTECLRLGNYTITAGQNVLLMRADIEAVLLHSNSPWLRHWCAFFQQLTRLIEARKSLPPNIISPTTEECVRTFLKAYEGASWTDENIQNREWSLRPIMDNIMNGTFDEFIASSTGQQPNKRQKRNDESPAPPGSGPSSAAPPSGRSVFPHDATASKPQSQSHTSPPQSQSYSNSNGHKRAYVDVDALSRSSDSDTTSLTDSSSASSPPYVNGGSVTMMDSSEVVEQSRDHPRSLSPQPLFNPADTQTAPIWHRHNRPIDPACCHEYNFTRCAFAYDRDSKVVISSNTQTTEKRCGKRHICCYSDCTIRFSHPHPAADCRNCTMKTRRDQAIAAKANGQARRRRVIDVRDVRDSRPLYSKR